MTKFAKAEKIEAVMAVKEGESIARAAKLYQMSPEVIKRSLDLYQQFRLSGLSRNSYNWTIEVRPFLRSRILKGIIGLY